MDNTQRVFLKKTPTTGSANNIIVWLKIEFSSLAFGYFFIFSELRNKSAFFLRLSILAIGLPASVSAFAAKSATGTYYQGDGVVWRDNNTNMVVGSTWKDTDRCNSAHSGAVLLTRDKYNWGSAGGYYGIVLAPDIVLSLQGTANYDGKSDLREFQRLFWTFNYRSNHTYRGYFVTNAGANISETWDRVTSNSGDTYLQVSASNIKHGGQVIYSETKIATQLYIGSNATPGTYFIPEVKFQYFCVNAAPVLLASTITVKKRELACTISTPGVIDFGSFNVKGHKDGAVLGVRNGNLTVNCSSNGNSSATAKVSVTGEKGRYTNALKMTMTPSAAAPAEIRGFIGPGITQNGVCDGNSNYPGWIQFTNATQNINLGSFKTGTNSIPYSFSLCSTGGANTGKASATATINLSWD